MSDIRNLVPYAASFGPQANDENHFFEEAELGEVFTVDKSLPPKTIHSFASKSGWGIEYCAPGSPEYVKHGRLTYKITGKCMEFETVLETTTIEYSCAPLYFDKFVYVQMSANSIESISVSDNNQTNKKTLKWGTCVSRKHFDDKISEHGLDPSWAIKFWTKNEKKNTQIVALTPRQLKMYSIGNIGRDFLIDEPDDVLDILRRGDTQLLVHKPSNCDRPMKSTEYTPACSPNPLENPTYLIMYDVDWNPIYRLFSMIFRVDGYDCKSILHFLKECKEVKDAAYHDSYRGIMFTYIPNKKTFEELAELAFNNKSYEIPKKIVNILCLEQFKIDVRFPSTGD